MWIEKDKSAARSHSLNYYYEVGGGGTTMKLMKY